MIKFRLLLAVFVAWLILKLSTMSPLLYIFASLGLGVLASLVRMTSDFMEGVKMSWRYHFILAFFVSLVCGFVFFSVKKSKRPDRQEETVERERDRQTENWTDNEGDSAVRTKNECAERRKCEKKRKQRARRRRNIWGF